MNDSRVNPFKLKDVSIGRVGLVLVEGAAIDEKEVSATDPQGIHSVVIQSRETRAR